MGNIKWDNINFWNDNWLGDLISEILEVPWEYRKRPSTKVDDLIEGNRCIIPDFIMQNYLKITECNN